MSGRLSRRALFGLAAAAPVAAVLPAARAEVSGVSLYAPIKAARDARENQIDARRLADQLHAAIKAGAAHYDQRIAQPAKFAKLTSQTQPPALGVRRP